MQFRHLLGKPIRADIETLEPRARRRGGNFVVHEHRHPSLEQIQKRVQSVKRRRRFLHTASMIIFPPYGKRQIFRSEYQKGEVRPEKQHHFLLAIVAAAAKPLPL
jgi:hypothetical protein